MVENLLPPAWRTPRKIYFFWTIVLPAVIGYLTAIFVRSGVILYLLLIPLLGIGLLIEACIILLLVIGWAMKRSPTTLKHLRRHGGIALFLVVNGIVNYSVGSKILNSDERSAMAYCESVIPLIESYASQQGNYPETLSQIQNLPTQPRLSRTRCIYHRRDEGYELTLRYPSSFGSKILFHQSP
ncbi:hypothetical protein IQ254_23595 [Nodosilinea sp. LEGE 07088]|uniref:hypothetical protein n=1 Tax=Nodosilinea sp. LEGE 07088 TaxID=2777968 RepID=UPI0018820245|nr:hypothetical protein [Nodosilinea sp. LEGE 07088]MBE9140145.1 hypothetical protein [Nodosilinea sp. LEGE 07088]